MPVIIFQTNALKIDNMGGGYPTKELKDEVFISALEPKKIIRRRVIATKRQPGSDYVVFNCQGPDCGKRNRQSVYAAKGQTKDGRLSFKCNGCRREHEVQRPIANEKDTMITIPKPERLMPGTLLGPDGRPIGVYRQGHSRGSA